MAELLAQRVVAKGWLDAHYDRIWMERLAELLHDRIKVLEDIEEQHSYFFKEPADYQEEAVAQFLRQEGIAGRLLLLRDRLGALPNFEVATIEEATRAIVAEQQWQTKDLIHPARVALTGRSVSPPLFGVMSVLGRDKVLKRLEYAATQLTQTKNEV